MLLPNPMCSVPAGMARSDGAASPKPIIGVAASEKGTATELEALWHSTGLGTNLEDFTRCVLSSYAVW